MKLWVAFCLGIIVGVIIKSIMPDYIQSGYNQYLLRPLEATFVEQEGIDSSSALEQISGYQVKDGKISSLKDDLIIDLEKGNIRISNGNIDLFTFGRLSDGTQALLIKDSENNDIGKIDENGLTILNGKISVFNNENNIIINKYGLTTNNFRTETIIKKADQVIGGDGDFIFINNFSFNINLKTETTILIFANIQFDCTLGSFDTGDVTFLFSIDGKSIPTAPYGNPGYWFDPGASTSTLTYITKLSPGQHSFKVFAARMTPDITLTILGANGNSNFGYLLLGGI